MGSSYAVYLFLGNYTRNNTGWATDANLVGVHGVFANMKHNGSWHMIKDMGMDELKTTGSLPLTTMLIDKVATGELASLAPQYVEPYLAHNLDWRCAYYDGSEVPINSVVDLSVSVVQSLVKPAVAEDQFPVWGQFKALVNVTADKPGGHNSKLWDCPEDGSLYDATYGTDSNSGSTTDDVDDSSEDDVLGSSAASSSQVAAIPTLPPVTIVLTTTMTVNIASCPTTCAEATIPTASAYASAAPASTY